MTRAEAIRILASSCISGSKQTEALETLIPELAESEDERIRKEIIDFIQWAEDRGMTRHDYHQAKRPAVWIAYLEKQKVKEKQDRMMPVYNDRDSFESALDKAWKSYNESGARTVDGFEDDYVECAHAKGFREGYLFGIEKQKDLTTENIYKHSRERMSFWNGQQKEQKPADLSDMMVHKEPYIAPVPTPMVADEQKPAEWRRYIWATNLRFDFTALIKYDNTDNYEIVQAGNRPKQEKNGVYILIKDIKPQSHWKPSEDELAKRHLEGYIMGREDTMREMKDFIESHFNTQSGTSTLKAEG